MRKIVQIALELTIVSPVLWKSDPSSWGMVKFAGSCRAYVMIVSIDKEINMTKE